MYLRLAYLQTLSVYVSVGKFQKSNQKKKIHNMDLNFDLSGNFSPWTLREKKMTLCLLLKGFLYDTAPRCWQVCLGLIQRRTYVIYISNYLSLFTKYEHNKELTQR